LALETLGRVKGMPQLEWLNTVQTKLSAGLGLDSTSVPVISFEENEFLKGLEYLESLYQFINHKRVLQISYQGYRQENVDIHTIHPYYLKQYNNRWFLYGWNEGMERLQNMALDRILDVSEANEVQYRYCTIDFEAYFEDIIGVTNPEDQEVERIVLKFSTSRLPYVISKPLHGSQRLKDGFIHLELKVNRELISLLLSYGSDVEILEPMTLRETISSEINKMQGFY